MIKILRKCSFGIKKTTTAILLTQLVYLVGAFSGTAQADPEDWYAYLGAGLAAAKYPNSWDRVFDSWGASSNSFRFTMSRDLGLYFPIINGSTVIGAAVSNTSDAISNDVNGTFGIENYLFAASVLSFAGTEPGDGFFARADLGRGWVHTTDVPLNSTSVNFNSLGKGTGYVLGLGYGKKTGPGARILFALSVQSTNIDGNKFQATRLTGGVLF